VLDGGVPKLENIVVPGQGPMPLIDVTASLGKSAVTWTDLRWIRESWKGPIIIKGVLIADDARRAVNERTSAIVGSNHGATELDCVLPTIRALPGDCGGGWREDRNTDGRRDSARVRYRESTLPRRAGSAHRPSVCVWAAAGQAGAERAIKILRDDVENTLRLLGCGSVQELNTSFIECSVRTAKGGGCMSEQESSSRRAFFKPAPSVFLSASAVRAMRQTSK
jgi:hypothetical protein